MTRERDQLRAELATEKAEKQADALYIAETTHALDEVQDSIAKVASDLHLVHVSVSSTWTEGGNTGTQQSVLTDVEGIRGAVQANLAKLAEVEGKYRSSATEVGLLRSIVQRLQETLSEQQIDLDAMEKKIREINDESAKKSAIIQQHEGTITEQRQQIEEIKEVAHRGYLVIASIDELQQNGIVEGVRGGFLNLSRHWRLKPDLASRKDRFQAVNTEELREIPLQWPPGILEILSPPPASYRLESDGPERSILRVLDPESFWQQRFVAVLIKHSVRRP